MSGKTYPPNAIWTREDASYVCEHLEKLLKEKGAHLALAGSVMYKGWSSKDLDLIIYPHQNWARLDPLWTHAMIEECEKFFRGKAHRYEPGVNEYAREIWWLMTPKNKKVEIFFLHS